MAVKVAQEYQQESSFLRKRVIPRLVADSLLWISIISVGTMLAGLSIMRYLGYNADMFDLGNMAQAISSVRHGEPLIFTYSSGQMSRLALHVEWIYFLLALPYALWPDPRLLIGMQAALFALGALPVYHLALRRLKSQFAARCLALIYLFYPVAQTGVLLDIHGDTLAMPLLLFALEALDRRAWRTYALFIALALSCKFYVTLPVALMGPLIWWQYGARRVGLLTTATALGYGALAFLVIRPFFTTVETSEIHRGMNYISFYFGQMQTVLETWDWRIANAVVVFGPVFLLAWRGWRWLLPGVPIAIGVLLSTMGGSAGYGSHHYGLVVPFIIMAVIEGTQQLQQQTQTLSSRRPRRSWRGDLGLTCGIVLIFNLALIDTPLSPTFWMGLPGKGLDHTRFGIMSRDRMKDRFLHEVVPPAAPLATSLFLAPHLVDREILHMVRYEVGQGERNLPTHLPHVDYVLADALFDFRVIVPGKGVDGTINSEVPEIAQVLQHPDFSLVTARDGLVLFRRNAPATQVLEQRIETHQQSRETIPQARFGDTIDLINAQIVPLDGRRFRATFEWQLTGSAPLTNQYVAVSRIDGLADARIVHLPTYALLPTHQWQPGQVVRETFDVEIPAELTPGRYTWHVGWYDVSHSEAFATDERSRLPSSTEVEIMTITVP